MTSFNLSSISFDPSVLKTGTGFLDTYAKPLIEGFRTGLIGNQDDALLAKADQQVPGAPILPPPPTGVSLQSDPTVSVGTAGTTPPIASPGWTPTTAPSPQPSSPFTASPNQQISDDLGIDVDKLDPKYRDGIINAWASSKFSKKQNDDQAKSYNEIFDNVFKKQREMNAENQANQMAAFYATRNQRSFEKMAQALASRPIYTPQTITFNPQVTPGVIYRLGPTFNPQQQQG